MIRGRREMHVRKMKLLVLALMFCAPMVAQEGTRLYRNERCGIEFHVPNGWVAAPSRYAGHAKQDLCAVWVHPENLEQLIKKDDGVDLYSIEIQVISLPFEQSVKDSNFERRDGKWVTVGRMEIITPAEEIASSEWKGVRGTATVAFFHEGGGNAGLGDMPAALISRGDFSARFEGSPQSEQEFESVLKSFRFVRNTK